MKAEPGKWTGPWVAYFTDGPQADKERLWSVGPPWHEIVLAPVPRRQIWFIAGGDGIPPRDDELVEPWAGETLYRLDSTKLVKDHGEQVMLAFYRLAKRGGDPLPNTGAR